MALETWLEIENLCVSEKWFQDAGEGRRVSIWLVARSGSLYFCVRLNATEFAIPAPELVAFQRRPQK